MDRGFIFVNSSFTRWEWYRTPYMVHLFAHLMMEADENRTLTTSIRRLSAETGISERCVRTCLKNLEATHYLTRKPTRKNTIITICDYAFCEPCFDDTDTQSDTQSDTLKRKETEKDKRKLSPTPPIKEKEKEKENEKFNNTTIACACEGFLEKFFSPLNQGNLQLFVEQMHRLDSDIRLISDLRPYVDEVLARWGLTEKVHYDYHDWSTHLIDTMRKIISSNAKTKTNDSKRILSDYSRRQWELAARANAN